ncbi:MAG: hypothetical protein DWQ19_10440 [Crenarchaeota archaeon]|nr:MAG: hypothetical protein DWQ19_10440 [Thermoproteota archaeon]
MKAKYLVVTKYGAQDAVEALVEKMEKFDGWNLMYPPVITVNEVSPTHGMSTASTVMIFENDEVERLF